MPNGPRRPEEPAPVTPLPQDELVETVAEKEGRKLRARAQSDRGLARGLGVFGMVGWSVAVPTLLGIAGAFVQVGLMVVPIYVLGMEEPLQVFVWVALSYPISRAVKNAALLLLLRRHAPVLPLREGVVFALRLAVLSALVGAAVWGTLQGMQRWLPYEQYRAQVVSLGTGMVERTPPRTLHYAAALLLHCGVSTGAGLFVMGVLLKVLGFPELGYLIEWVRDRGWRRRAAEEGAPDAVA